VKGMNDLYRKAFLPLLGFFGGLAWLVTGLIIGFCTSPEQIEFLGLTLIVVGLVLIIVGGCYFVGIADDGIKRLQNSFRKKSEKNP